MQVLALSNQKGGCGKTTAAINLSAALASLGHKTLLIDLDPQAHATFGLGVRSEQLERTIYNVLTTQPERRCAFLENVLVPIAENLDLAPSHILLSTIEQEYTSKDESVSRLHEVLLGLSFPYDYVVIDCPPSLGFLTFNALRAAKTLIVPIELSSFSLMGVTKLLSMIELLRVKLSHTPRVYALPTMVDMRTRFSKHMLAEIREAFGSNIFDNSIRQTVAIREAQAKGVSVFHYEPNNKAALDFRLLAQEIISKVSSDPDQSGFLPEPNTAPSDRLKDFILSVQGAREVHLVGDFNNWRISDQSLLWQKEEGLWQKKVFLEPGKYRYKFIIDGQWITDPSNDFLEANPYGGLDSVLEIQ